MQIEWPKGEKTKKMKFSLGIVSSLFLVSILSILDQTPYSIPNSPAICSSVIILIAFHWGLWAAMSCAVIAWIYAAIHFSIPDQLFHYTKPDFIRIITWGVIFPFEATMIGTLKERLLHRVESEKMLQKKLVSSSKLVAMGELAAGIAHEINTPIGAILLNAEIIEMELSENPEQFENSLRRTRSIMDISVRISKIIQGLKGFSRDTSNEERRNVSFAEIIESVTLLCGEKCKRDSIDLKIEDFTQGQGIYGQNVALSQVVLNLVNNAADAIRDSTEKWILVSGRLQKDLIEILVTDSGHGIPEKVQAKLFQPFFTTKDIGQGTGLGLSISRDIVLGHKGELFYDTSCSNTRFVIRLPRYSLRKVEA